MSAFDYVQKLLNTCDKDPKRFSDQLTERLVRLTAKYTGQDLETIIMAAYKDKIFVYAFVPEPNQVSFNWRALTTCQANQIFGNPNEKKRIFPLSRLTFGILDLWVVQEEADALIRMTHNIQSVIQVQPLPTETSCDVPTIHTAPKTGTIRKIRNRDPKDCILKTYATRMNKTMSFNEWVKKMQESQFEHQDRASYNRALTSKDCSKYDDSDDYVRNIALIRNGLTAGKKAGKQKYLIAYKTLNENTSLSPVKTISDRTLEGYFRSSRT